MTRRRVFAVSALAFVAFTVRPKSLAGQTASAPLGTVHGHVLKADGQPLQGATITSAGAQHAVITKADGAYELKVSAGSRELRVQAVGYALHVATLKIAAGQTIDTDVHLDRVKSSLDAVAILGTRGAERSVISAPVPIDVLSNAAMTQSGRTETAQMIQSIAPSFNLPRTTVGDGTDHIRPASLRGLSPDQTLILVNGKRRHTSALVNVNGFVGRGSQAVDLNAIPSSMIDHIEILRDGAAAQYGSDAIAGVINLVLKTSAPSTFSVDLGQNMTTYNRDATSAVAFPAQMSSVSTHDGDVVTGGLNYGLKFGERGFLQLGGEVRDRAGTNRTLPDTRQQYFTGDPRNANPAAIDSWQGDSYNHDTQLFGNLSQTFANGTELYAFGGYGYRRGAAAGMWRRPNDDRTVRAIYPDGFLPFIKSDINDGSGSAGVTGRAMGWKWDLGTVYGRNSFAFGVDNSANTSVGATSKTSFDAGELAFGQSTTTLDLSREARTPWNAPLRIALGGEFRADQYKITAGDSDSFRDAQTFVLDKNGLPTDRLAPAGAQVFPGFRPGDAGTHDRNNVAAYLDLESDVTQKLLLDVAGRVERYSDFGATTTGKVAARYAVTRSVALRGAASTGFRAPSLGQEFFSSTATNFINGQAFDVRTFPVASPEARVLGARDLKPERSVNLSAGIALEPITGLALTVDYYHIAINKRIVLTDNFLGAAVQALFDTAGLRGVSGGRYFSNAIDTRSDGVDIVASYTLATGSHSTLQLTSGYNNNQVRVSRVDSTPTKLKAFQEQLFGRVERARIEHGNPRDNFYVSANQSLGGLGINARTQRYGEVRLAGTTPINGTGPLDQTFGAKWITDISGSFTLLTRFTFTIGADNLFDVYPDRNLNPGDPATANGGISNFGLFPYNAISPFGFNGRFVYTKFSVRL